MTAPLARVGDVIAHGEAIPANVFRFVDDANDAWWRTSTDPRKYTWIEGDDDPYDLDEIADRQSYWPMTVTEVDPELRPACFKCGRSTGRIVEVSAAKPRFMHAYGSCESDGEVTEEVAQTFGLEWPRPKSQSAAEVLDMPQLAAAAAAESGPVVLSLPQVPDGTVALVAVEGEVRYETFDGGGTWFRDDRRDEYSLTDVLIEVGPAGVTVEMAPPREPRTWPKLDVPSLVADLPRLVDVDGHGRWSRVVTHHFYPEADPNGAPLTLAGLRELGEVREVLT